MSKPVDFGDLQLDDASAQRRETLLDFAYRHYFASLKRQLARTLGCEAAASDIAHSAFLVLAEHRDPGEIRDPKRYLFRVALNLAGSYGRSDGRRRRLLREQGETIFAGRAAAAGPEQIAIWRGDLEFAARVIGGMPKKRRQAIVLFLYHEAPYDEIARRLNISESAVRSHLSRALRECRDALYEKPDRREGAARAKQRGRR